MNVSMAIENKKYCIIPFTGTKADSFYGKGGPKECPFSLQMQFNCLEKHVVLDKTYKDSLSPIQRPNEAARSKWNSQQETIRKIRTPFLLDTVVNQERHKPENQKPSKNKDSIMENVRLVMQADTQFEDEAMGMSSANVLATEDIMAMD